MTLGNEELVELRPCPFCGGDASCSPCDDSGEVVYAVACLSCEAQITNADEAGAIEQWNTRSALPQDGGWQPIETAPKDGTVVLLWLKRKIDRHYPSYGLCDLFCIGLHQYGRWVSLEVEDCGSMGSELTGWMSDWCHLDVEPTHWMPLPEPPSTAPKQGGGVD